VLADEAKRREVGALLGRMLRPTRGDRVC